MKYIYLHGFLSGPGSNKGRFLDDRFRERNILLNRPDLNEGDFEHMTFTRQFNLISKLVKNTEDEVTLIGSSLGAYLAAVTAERMKEVRRLVLMAPAWDFPRRYSSRLTAEQKNDWKEKGYLKVFHFQYQDHRKLGYGILEDAEKYMNLALSRQIPAQIFHGIRDEAAPYRLSVDYLEAHPMADLILLNSDHGLLDKLDIIWDYLQQFLGI